MRRQLHLLQTAGLLLILASGTAQAFNDQREAFVVGLGIGYHTTDLDYSYADNRTESASVSGLATSVRIGFGISNQTILYYLSDGDWYNRAGSTWFSGINALGAAYYFSPGPRSAYVHGGYGYSYHSLPRETSNNSKFGNGYTLGIGYEFIRHVSVEASYLRTNIKDAIDGPHPSRTSSWRLMLNYLFY